MLVLKGLKIQLPFLISCFVCIEHISCACHTVNTPAAWWPCCVVNWMINIMLKIIINTSSRCLRYCMLNSFLPLYTPTNHYRSFHHPCLEPKKTFLTSTLLPPLWDRYRKGNFDLNWLAQLSLKLPEPFSSAALTKTLCKCWKTCSKQACVHKDNFLQLPYL